MSLGPAEILLIEDNEGDAVLVQTALNKSRIKNNLQVVENGIAAMVYLRKEGSFAHAVRPHLILLDLNLPRKDGREVLAEIKADPDLRSIPVIVFTSSDMESDIIRAYDLHANGYIRKPNEFPKYCTVINALMDFWFSIITLPLSEK